MAINRNKVLASAQKHLSKGNFDKAIVEFEKLVKDDPNDVRTLLKIGDVHTRRGSKPDAVKTYHRVAEHYARGGFFLKAVAVYKQILKLQPGRNDVTLRLGEMYENLQLISDALSTYEQLSQAYARDGDAERMLEVLQRMRDLDPENVPVRIKFAEALSKFDRRTEAADEFQAGAELLRQQGRMDDYLKVAERLLYHRPDDLVLARSLAVLYLERQDAKRALAKLQLCFQKDPKDPETLEALGQAFLLLGQTPKTVSVYWELARTHEERGNAQARASVLKRILELDPNDPEAREALAGYARGSQAHAAPPPPPPAPTYAPQDVPEAGSEPSIEFIDPDSSDALIIEEPEEDTGSVQIVDDELLIIDDEADVIEVASEETALPSVDDGLGIPLAPSTASFASNVKVPEFPTDPPRAARASAQPVSAPGPAPVPVIPQGFDSEPPPPETTQTSIPPDVAREAQIARLMTECDVFARYGLKDKVVTQLGQVLSMAPQHIEARERLRDALAGMGRAAEAAEHAVFLADLTTDPAVRETHLRHALELDPKNVAAKSALGAAAEIPASEGPTSSQDLVIVEEEDDFGDATMFEPGALGQALRANLGGEAPAVDLDAPATSFDAEVQLAAPPSSPPSVEPQAPPTMDLAPVAPPAPIQMPPLESSAPELSFDHEPEFESDAPPDFAAQDDFGDATIIGSNMDLASLGAVMHGSAAAPKPDELTDETRATPPEESTSVGVRLPDVPPPREGGPRAVATQVGDEHPLILEEDVDESTSPRQSLASVSAPAMDAPPPAEVSQEIVPEVEEALDEAEFFIAQGLLEEARSTLEDALSSNPTSVPLQVRLDEVIRAQSERRRSTSPPANSADAFAMAERLAEEIDEEVDDAASIEGSGALEVGGVIEQFKKGIEETVDEEDSETHFDLGIAYKEMGLHDDAISEFEIAMKNPVRECICRTMVGLCRIEQGMTLKAIESFKRGLHARRKSEREELGLYFELGHAYELLDDPQEALFYFEQVKVRDPEFRGVSQRIDALKNPGGAAAMTGTDDVDAAFDDLLNDE